MTADEANRPRILVVDDDPGILRAVSRILGREYDTLCVSSPKAACQEGAVFAPDLAIIDVRLPEMNGFDLMHALRRGWPDIDVIIMTGNAEEPEASLIRAIEDGAFYFIQKPFDRRVLVALVVRCLELRRLRLEKSQYTQRLEQELREARQFQLSMLPPDDLRLVDLEISARYVACTELAGDFFDYAVAGDENIAVIMADVVGHGASAAMMTGIVKSAFRSSETEQFDPPAVVDRVKEAIRGFDPGRFVTLFCARINRRTHRMTYMNAGHPSPIWRRSRGEAHLLESTGPLISSALCEQGCEEKRIALEPNDYLFCYTDGLTEAQGPEGLFGEQRLIALVSKNGVHGRENIDRILATVTEFTGSRPFQDDITLLSVELIQS
jgi:sigma-B regulation protein RsbU (phosphoserine phosphatase)